MEETSNSTKHCCTCGVEKPLTEFYPRRVTKDGRRHDCKSCSNKACMRYQARRRAVDPKLCWAKNALSAARVRARKSGVPFDITVKDILAIAVDVCPILYVPLRYPQSEDMFTPNRHYPSSPSLDRIIPELGYVRGNLAVISHRGNRIKNDATASELRSAADWLDRQLHQSS